MERLEHFKNLMVMAAADGHMTEEELQLLSERSSMWGISADQFRDAIHYALSPEASLNIPPSKRDRLEMLSELVQMMAADGELAEIEKQLFAVAAARMEVSDAELNRLLDQLM